MPIARSNRAKTLRSDVLSPRCMLYKAASYETAILHPSELRFKQLKPIAECIDATRRPIDAAIGHGFSASRFMSRWNRRRCLRDRRFAVRFACFVTSYVILN
jgi:hypothetical protein